MRENKMIFSNSLVNNTGVTSFARQTLLNTGPGEAPSYIGAYWFSQL